MANTALLANDVIVDAESMTDADFLQLQVRIRKDKLKLTGIFCGHSLFPRRGNERKVNHFVHHSNGVDCKYETKGESDQHKALKLVIQEVATGLGFEAKVENILSDKAISDVSIINDFKHLVIEVQLASQTHASYSLRNEHRKNAGTESVWLTTEERNLNIANVDTILIKNLDSNKYVADEDGITVVIGPSNLDEFKKNVSSNTRFVMHDSSTEIEVELNVEELVQVLMSPNMPYVYKRTILDRKLKKSQAVESNRRKEALDRNKIHSKLYNESITGNPTNLLELIAAARNNKMNPVKAKPQDEDVFKYVPVKYRDRITEKYTTESLKEHERLLVRLIAEGSVISTWANPNCTCIKTSPKPNYQNLAREDYITVSKAIEALKMLHGEKWCHREDQNIFGCIVTDADGVHKTLQDFLMFGYFARQTENLDSN